MPEQPDQHVDTRTLSILAFSATAGVLVEFYILRSPTSIRRRA